MFSWIASLFGNKKRKGQQQVLAEKRRLSDTYGRVGSGPAANTSSDTVHNDVLLTTMLTTVTHPSSDVTSPPTPRSASEDTVGTYGTRDYTGFKTGGGFGGDASVFKPDTSSSSYSSDSSSHSSSSSSDWGSSSSSDSGWSSSSDSGGGGFD